MIGYVGAAATKSVMLGVLILVTARFFVPYEIAHPFWMLCFLVLTAVTFSLFGFIIGLWADSFQKLQVIPLMIVTPLTFLGGAFYSIDMLPPLWQKITLFNPVVYLISGFRWSFYGIADVNVGISAAAILGFLTLCLVGRVVDLQDRLQAQGVIRGESIPKSAAQTSGPDAVHPVSPRLSPRPLY